MTAALEADRLYRFFHAGDDETLALRGVSLTLESGQLVAVTGPSGSGKSTLLACLAGLDEPDGGTVTIGGQRLNRRPEAERAAIRASSVGVLYQQANLVGHLSVEANVALAQRLGAGANAAAGRRSLLERVGLAKRMRAQPRELSGGELARAGLAVALANDPVLVLADEPTGELDDANAARVLDLLRERAQAGAAILVATHDPAIAEQADHTVRLRDGEVES
ncbi:MAG: putative transport system ATP-binding protein [Thermoleophilaceae bacterium]|jgi:putative ABC transport system ATP-binding protein|nr:putative transport system ATP-binding protein [Thermoleophilaceae bacterium]MEA2456062.1 putative transport system ATP-binding protein [Thermoleophilaceae bacterium]